MTLSFQDPNDPDGLYLVEALLEACQKATRGGAAFAFATASGAKLFLEDEVFVTFAKANSFDLVIGIDAITNEEALKAIVKATDSATGVKVYVFLHDRPQSLFHPKFCWFRTPTGGQLVVGSGNLTIGGLRANWEAYSVNALGKAEASDIVTAWTRWMSDNSSFLLAPNDPKVLERAKHNTGWARLVKPEEESDKKKAKGATGAVSGEAATEPIRDGDDVLVAEIPRSGNRWNQANFDLHTYEHFFGAKLGTQRRILLQHVDSDGHLADVENRPSVAVRSQNYRFELEAASGLRYPKKLRPIAVFVRVAKRTFRYRLLMPSDSHYATAQTFLDQKWTEQGNRVRRVVVKVEELRKAWPSAVLWNASI
jgi:HKD family nuclease